MKQKDGKEAKEKQLDFHFTERSLVRFLLTLALLLVASTHSNAVADEGDDSLRLLLSKSSLIVTGKLRAPIIGIRWEAGTLTHACDFEVTEVLHGDPKLKDQHLHVTIFRFESDPKDRHPLIAKDAECILFLKPKSGMPGSWETSDVWFGIQHPSPTLAKALAQLSVELKSKALK